jgi:arylsulfatase A
MMHHLSAVKPSACGISCLLLIGSTSFAQTSRQTDTRPNIVLIISDDQTWTDFGFMGNADVQTPHLDRLAEQSARFVNGYVPSSVCRPSLVTLLTGLYPHQHGVHFNHPPPGFAALTRSPEIDKARFDALRREATRFIRAVPTLPRILAGHGYRCLQTGKYWEGHWRNAGFTEGMTIAEPSGGPYGDKTLAGGDVVAHGNGDHGLVIGRRTMQPIYDFIDDCGDTPFFVWYAPFLPHSPHDAPEEYYARYRGQPQLDRFRIPYYASISWFDDTVGELIDFVERRGLADNTVFLFVVDNGWEPDPDRFVAARNEWDHTLRSKRSPFDDGLRAPILIRWNGHTHPATIEGLVSSIDVVPTLLAAAGIDVDPFSLPGLNLLPIASGDAVVPADRAVFGEIYPGDATVLGNPARDVAYRWVRQRNLKLIVPESHDGAAPWNRYLTEPALFDVVSDPKETRDLVDDERYRDDAARLRELLDEWWSLRSDGS